MKWSHFQRDMQDICLCILLTARDPNGENRFHEKSESSIEKAPNNPEKRLLKTFQTVHVDNALRNVLPQKSLLCC